MAFEIQTELTPREHLLMEHEAEQARLTREYSLTVKQLELDIIREKNRAAIELKRLESRWASWLRIPIHIIKLPVYVVFGIAYVAAVICHVEPSKEFWNYLK